MIEHENEIRDIIDIINYPIKGDKITASNWIDNDNLIDGLIYKNNRWCYLFGGVFTSIITQYGFINKNGQYKTFVKWQILE